MTPGPLVPHAVELLRAGTHTAAGVVQRWRDLLLFRSGATVFVLACDSNASIGHKPHDALQQDPSETGYSASKVPMMEVIAAGATPFVLIDNLCCELEPTGRQLLVGIERLIAESGLDVVITGSDETNMPTVQTGIGVTVIGVAADDELRLGRTAPGDTIYCVGTPADGRRVPFVDGEPGIATPREVLAAATVAGVHEMLPVGSRGVGYEIGQLGGADFRLVDPSPIDLEVSAGPSTCFLVSGRDIDRDELAAAVAPCPVAVVATVAGASPRVGTPEPPFEPQSPSPLPGAPPHARSE